MRWKKRNDGSVRKARIALRGFVSLVAVVGLVALFGAHDAGRLQAQTLTDRQILEAFYTATNGGSWTTSTNWNDDNEDLDDWHGVSADSSDNVTGLVLDSNNLTGSIPSSLGGLSELQTLTLSENQLSGSIPAELGNASKLVFVALWDNDLTGSIPSELGNLSALRSLRLEQNQLSGSIPSELGNLSALTEIELFGNQLTGEIPSSLGNLTNLFKLHLDQNQLSGSIPSELGNLSKLQYLRLHTNKLTGSIPSELGNLSKLETLQLYNNELTGSIPPELGNAGSSVDAQDTRTDNLTILSFSSNQLSGEIPSELGDLSALQYLLLNGNRLEGEIPEELGDLSNLLWLWLNGNRLTGSIPTQLGSLSALTQLYLNNNRLTGSIPSALGNLGKSGNVNNLLYLVLWDNQLTGSIPSELGRLSSLQWLSLSQNKLSGSIPSSLGNLTSLIWLYLNQNELSGSIPTQLGSLTALTSLYLNNNELTGSIPTQMNSLTALNDLYLHDNQLSGDVPNLNGLTALGGLGLGGNDLDLDWSMFESGADLKLDLASDSVWNASGNDRSLLYLYLHDSGLTEDIPLWLGANHTDLIELWLHDNGLTGTVPTNLNSLTSLTNLRLSGNSLTGGYSVLDGLDNLRFLIRDGGPGEQVFKSGVNSYVVKVAPVQDATEPKSEVTWLTVAVEDVTVDLLSHPDIASVVEVVAAVDVDVAGELTSPAVVCVPVPASTMLGDDQELVLLHEFDDGLWRVLESAEPPSGYDPGVGNVAVCGTTDSFSVFVAAVVDVVAEPMPELARPAPILRIAPSIRSATVSGGDVIRLRFDIYGRQDILDNKLGEGHVFEWSDDGAGGRFRSTERVNEVLYTAPEALGRNTLTVTAPDDACLGGDDADEVADRCTAIFTITVRRGLAVPEERPAPENPRGEIPSVLVDAKGRQYAVFTPEDGGTFEGGDVTLSAGAGVVPDLEIVGVRADVAGPASNVGMSDHRYSLAGRWYEVRAVYADESQVFSYVLESPLSVCVPLPEELGSNFSDVALVLSNADGTLTILSSDVRITMSGRRVCGGLGTLPASVAVGSAGAPSAIPTLTVEPDTGGYVPSVGVLVLLMVVGMAVVVVFGTRMRRIFEL